MPNVMGIAMANCDGNDHASGSSGFCNADVNDDSNGNSDMDVYLYTHSNGTLGVNLDG